MPVPEPPEGHVRRTDLPWALELEDGQRCLLGPTNTFLVAGSIVTYFCADGSDVLEGRNPKVKGWIIGGLIRNNPVWEANYLPEAGENRTETSTVRIRDAWE